MTKRSYSPPRRPCRATAGSACCSAEFRDELAGEQRAEPAIVLEQNFEALARPKGAVEITSHRLGEHARRRRGGADVAVQRANVTAPADRRYRRQQRAQQIGAKRLYRFLRLSGSSPADARGNRSTMVIRRRLRARSTDRAASPRAVTPIAFDNRRRRSIRQGWRGVTRWTADSACGDAGVRGPDN